MHLYFYGSSVPAKISSSIVLELFAASIYSNILKSSTKFIRNSDSQLGFDSFGFQVFASEKSYSSRDTAKMADDSNNLKRDLSL